MYYQYLLNLIRRLLRKQAVRELKINPSGARRIICYRGVQKWSLSFVWRSLESTSAFGRSSNTVEAFACDTTDELRQLFCASDAFVVVLSHVHLPVVLQAGIPPSRVIYYFAHITMNKHYPKLKKLHAVLAQNMFERNLAVIRGVKPEKAHYFPAGVDRRLFFPPAFISDANCDVDVLFASAYVSPDNVGYYFRKQVRFQIDLASALAKQGLRTVFLGPGWDQASSLIHPLVRLYDPPYSSYPEWMRKSRLLCSVAVQEGGPLSFPEGLACGCSMLSVMTGLPLSFSPGVEGVWHMPIDANIDEWTEQINKILATPRASSWPKDGKREQFLKQADFEQLGQQLRSVCFPDPV